MPALKDADKAWLDRFTGGLLGPPLSMTLDQKAINAAFKVKRDAEEIAERTLKQVMLDSAFKELDGVKEDIRDAFNFEVKVDGKKQRTMAPQKEGFDTEDTSKSKGISAERKKQTDAAMALLLKQKDRLADVTVKRSVPILKDNNGKISFETKEEALFTDDEIGRQFYEPLEREFVIPDNFVAARHSPTQKMVNDTNDLYIKECQEKGAPRNTGAVALTKAAANMAASLANAIVGYTSTLDPTTGAMNSTSDLGVDKQQQQATRIITDGLSALIGVGADVIDKSVDAAVEHSFKQSEWQAVANTLGMAIAKEVAGIWGSVNPTASLNIEVFETLGDGVSTLVAGAGVVGTIATWSSAPPPKPPFPADEVIDQLGTALSSAVSAFGDNISQVPGVSSSDSTPFSIDINALSGAIAVIKSTAAKAVTPDVEQQFESGDIKSALVSLCTTFVSSSASAIAGAIGNAGEDAANTDLKDQYKPLQNMQKEQEQIDKATQQIEGFSDKMIAEVERKLNIKLNDKLVAAQKKDEKTVEQELEDERKKYAAALEKLTKQDSRDEADFKTLNHLIANIERDKAIAKFAFAIMGAGTGISAAAVVTTIAPGLKAAGDAVKFIQNIYACVGRIQALIAWMDSYGDAVRSNNRYTSAVENFINSNRDLLCNNTVQAILYLGKMVADATSVVMPTMASAATALDTAATAADLVFQCYRQAELDKAWRMTLESIENPNNRKLALIVRELNPTLAKYSIAYGALIDKDPVAVRAMDRIGLDRETLMNPNNKVGDVRKYLESLYSDDLKLVAEMEKDRAKVKVPAPALTMKAWSLSCMLWSKSVAEEGGKWSLEAPREIMPNLERVEKYRGVSDPTKKEAALPQLFKALEALDAAFGGFEPEDPNGEPMEEVRKAAEQYSRLARATLQAEQLNVAAAKSASQAANVASRT
jgi:hypothetical protein